MTADAPINLRAERLWRELREILHTRPDLAARLCVAVEGEPMDLDLSHLPDLLTVPEAAALCRVGTRTIQSWITDGTLPAVRLEGARRVLIPRVAIEARLRPYEPDADQAARGREALRGVVSPGRPRKVKPTADKGGDR